MEESESKSNSRNTPLTPPTTAMHNDNSTTTATATTTTTTTTTTTPINNINDNHIPIRQQSKPISTSASITSAKSPHSQHSSINTTHSTHRTTNNGIHSNGVKFKSHNTSPANTIKFNLVNNKSPPNPSTTTTRTSRSRSLSSQQSTIGMTSPQLSQQLSHLHTTSQYLAQEKAYLRKMRNQLVDDYYTKGITGADDNLKEHGESEIDEDDFDYDYDDSTSSQDDFTSGDNTHLLMDIDNVDFGLTLSLLNKVSTDKKVSQLTKDDTDDPTVIERLEWQSMLTAVLTGDVVRSEKTKIINNNNPDNANESYLHVTLKENLWFGINAKLFNRTEDDQKRIVSYRRTLVDQLFQDILNFEVNYDNHDLSIRAQIETILDRYYEACTLWRTLEDMKNDEPICRSLEFQNRIDALTAWLNITDAIARETNSLRLWIGNDELDISKSPIDVPSSSNNKIKRIFDEDNKSLAERLMKEKDIQTIFRKRIFKPIAPWMIKSKDTYIRLGNMFEIMKLPDYMHDLLQICIIPMKLIKEIINVRLGYAMKLTNPTLMMIDQMIDDLKSYISVALEVKSGIQEYIKSEGSTNWILNDLFDNEISDFDAVVLRCVRYFLVLLNRKLLDSSRSPTNFRTFKEPDELEEAWNFLKTLGCYIDGGSMVVAEQITLLTSRLCHRLLAYFTNQIRSPPIDMSQDLIRWYSSTTDNFGQLRRKLARFTGEISRDFSNSLVFNIPNLPHANIKTLLDLLKSTNHFLVYTGTVETKGTYFFACGDLMNREQDLVKIINGSYIGFDPNEQTKNFSNLLNLSTSEQHSELGSNTSGDGLIHDTFDYSYVIALCPLKPIVWEGTVVNIHFESMIPITDVKTGQMLLITKLPYYELPVVRHQFLDLVSEVFMPVGGMKPMEQRCSLAKVHHELTKINRAFFKMCLAVLDSVKIVRDKVKGANEYQTLVNNFFIYSRDYGKNAVRNLDMSRKATVIMKLIQLSIDWVSFVCDDCIPTDRKTFRWCVLALEFAMDMTKGFNVLVLNEEQFEKLKIKVARCMSLLISHFDIMGARSSEAEKNKLLKWTSSRQHGIENSQDDQAIREMYHKEIMNQISEIENYRMELQQQLQSVGRVLDVTDSEYQYVTLLASSFSSLSIRWQKGRYIGGGTFGQVFSAVNLDTGGVMAVKEIRFHDSQSIKNIVPSIKEEMTVLEMLNHPNVVQYFGVEVHRDKVYIFMEYCEGGSLSGLLTHGRIEDEMVIQVYTLQMLEGLAYLHQSGVIHRDIKPENILLDHNGVIKFVDFGAAKVIANTGRTRGIGTTSIRSSGGVNNNLNSMTGTPMYMSPEVITGASTDRSGVVDIWSLGCCVLEMTTGRRPWSNLDNEWAIMYHIAAGHKPQLPSPDQMSEAGRRFLSRCLEHDPLKRPSAVELLADPWMVSIRQVAFGTGGDINSTPTSETGGGGTDAI